MTKKKVALIGMFLLASLTMVAHQSPQFQAQTTPNQAAFLMAVSTLSLLPSPTPDSILSPVVGAQQWLKAWRQILSVFAAILGAAARIYSVIQRNRDKTG